MPRPSHALPTLERVYADRNCDTRAGAPCDRKRYDTHSMFDVNVLLLAIRTYADRTTRRLRRQQGCDEKRRAGEDFTGVASMFCALLTGRGRVDHAERCAASVCSYDFGCHACRRIGVARVLDRRSGVARVLDRRFGVARVLDRRFGVARVLDRRSPIDRLSRELQPCPM
eukprot:3311837-Pyramimonas_sp.AAC.2